MGAYKLKPIHPFPARMAPEIALRETSGLKRNSLILDPMGGSGPSLKVPSFNGHRGIGFDTDPLAVIISGVWNPPIDITEFKLLGAEIAKDAKTIKLKDVKTPSIDGDEETKKFIKYWFGRKQINALRKLSFLIARSPYPYQDALFVALSRLIISKNIGASLAADISHSRPHKVKATNDFDTIAEYEK